MIILLTILAIILVFLCLFLGLLVLMQRASSNSGMGAALGGGMAESALGGSAGNTLTRITIWGIVLFFVLSLALYLGMLYYSTHQTQEVSTAANLGAVAAAVETQKAPAAEAPAPAAKAETPAPAAKAETPAPAAQAETSAPAPAAPKAQ